MGMMCRCWEPWGGLRSGIFAVGLLLGLRHPWVGCLWEALGSGLMFFRAIKIKHCFYPCPVLVYHLSTGPLCISVPKNLYPETLFCLERGKFLFTVFSPACYGIRLASFWHLKTPFSRPPLMSRFCLLTPFLLSPFNQHFIFHCFLC